MSTAESKQRPAAAPDLAGNIRVYSTLSREKSPLETVEPGKVGMYLCGPTVYKPSHIGHMVGPVIFDVVKRHLVYSGYEVKFVVNITDVDDKLINESAARGITMSQLAREMEGDYHTNLQAMGIDTIDHFPRATECMAEIIQFIEDLVAKGFAYAAEGDVYFDVARDHEYGKLSGRDVASMQGEGGEMAGRKRNTADFALWKSAKPGEPAWDSPWGKGRPGWHIECSAMSRALLGKTFDIHGGGLDLMFPHHENEIAQSECCHGQAQAKYWMHNGLMQAADEVGKVGGRNTRAADGAPDQAEQEAGKMGKSKGASPFRELLQQFPAETIRLFLLSSHYRRPIYFSEARIREAQTSLETFYRFFERYERVTGESFYKIAPAAKRTPAEPERYADPTRRAAEELRKKFLEAMDDDFNTGAAIAELFELARTLNKHVDQHKLEDPASRDAAALATLKESAAVLREMSAILGLFQKPVETAPAAGAGDELVGKLLELLVELRAEARATKNFALGDKIRNRLTELNVTLTDRPGGTEWKVG